MATDVDGVDTGTVPLGFTSTITPKVTGTANNSIVWKLNGAGYLSPTGVYWPPSDLPANRAVTVTATLVSNPSVYASYQFSLTNPAPSVRYVYPAELLPGMTNSVQVLGDSFVKDSIVMLNGRPVAMTYRKPTELDISIPVAATGASPFSLQVINPSPAGGKSATVQASVAAESVSLTVASSDGTTNSGTGRIGGWLHIVPTVTAPYNKAVNWTLIGAGSIAVGGWYQPPATMPSDPHVVVKVALIANQAVSATYNFTLVNAIPSIKAISPSQLPTAQSSQVKLDGSGFFPGTQILVNGSAVPTSFQSPYEVSAQIEVPDSAIAPLSIQAINPAPGGGASPVFAAPLQLKRVVINAYNVNGSNPATVTLGGEVQFIDSIRGPGDPSATWAVQGGGSISSNGLYRAPAATSSSVVTVTAALLSNPAAKASYQLSFVNPMPAINGTNPIQLIPGANNAVTIQGSGFTPSTTLLANGRPVSIIYQSPTSLLAQVPTNNEQSGSVEVVANNPIPAGGTSNVFPIPFATIASACAQVALQPGRTIPQDFLGLSHEWTGISWFLGTSSSQVNTIYRQLVKNLMNGNDYPFFIRIGGDSSDGPEEMSASNAQALSELAASMNVKYSIGVNMADGDPALAAEQAQFYVSKLPPGSVAAVELGNEPDNYGYYGHRNDPYTISDFLSDYTTWSAAVLPVLPNSTRFMGPAWASPASLSNKLSLFDASEGNNVAIVSQHLYGGYQGPGITFATDYLLTTAAATQGPQWVTGSAAVAHQNGQLFRVGEFNSIDGSGIPGISDAFGSALWAVDTMFEYAQAGIDGVNWHGNVNNSYCAFDFANVNVNGQNPYVLSKVAPLYYGMLFFQMAASNQAQLLPVTVQTNSNIKVWATEDKSGTVRVVILNKDKTFSGNVSISVPHRGNATMLQMLAPSYQSTDGVTIGGQTLDGSSDGTMMGAQSVESVSPADGVYTVPVQPTSAVLLTLPN